MPLHLLRLHSLTRIVAGRSQQSVVPRLVPRVLILALVCGEFLSDIRLFLDLCETVLWLVSIEIVSDRPVRHSLGYAEFESKHGCVFGEHTLS